MACQDGKIIVIVAPSGTGKSTLIHKAKEEFSELTESISYTTRAMRPREEDGVQYFFVDRDRFFQMEKNGEFLETALVYGNHYGTPLTFVEKCLEERAALLFDLDIKGAMALKGRFGKKAHIIFIAPPSMEELKSRLKKRGTESVKSQAVRIRDGKKELAQKDSFDHLIINDEVEAAYKRLREIIRNILEA